MHMSKPAIISLSIGVLSLTSAIGYIAYDTSTKQDKTDHNVVAATAEQRSPDTVSPFGTASSSVHTPEASVDTETINGIAVPPMPDKSANNATVAGIDSNANGVRDDIERIVAEKFGKDRDSYEKVISYSIIVQRGIVSPVRENGIAYTKTLACMSPALLEKYIETNIERSVFNTRGRADALITLMRSVNNEGHSCEFYK